jgi:hypothetical protein
MESLQNIINSDLITKIVYIFFGIIAIFWLWWIFWTTKDISQKTDNLFLEIFSILLVTLFWPLGLLYYFIIRPTGYKRDRNWRREAILSQVIECPECWDFNLYEFDYCKSCGEKLKKECKECSKNFPITFDYCPYCWAPNID